MISENIPSNEPPIAYHAMMEPVALLIALMIRRHSAVDRRDDRDSVKGYLLRQGLAYGNWRLHRISPAQLRRYRWRCCATDMSRRSIALKRAFAAAAVNTVGDIIAICLKEV